MVRLWKRSTLKFSGAGQVMPETFAVTAAYVHWSMASGSTSPRFMRVTRRCRPVRGPTD